MNFGGIFLPGENRPDRNPAIKTAGRRTAPPQGAVKRGSRRFKPVAFGAALSMRAQ